MRVSCVCLVRCLFPFAASLLLQFTSAPFIFLVGEVARSATSPQSSRYMLYQESMWMILRELVRVRLELSRSRVHKHRQRSYFYFMFTLCFWCTVRALEQSKLRAGNTVVWPKAFECPCSFQTRLTHCARCRRKSKERMQRHLNLT